MASEWRLTDGASMAQAARFFTCIVLMPGELPAVLIGVYTLRSRGAYGASVTLFAAHPFLYIAYRQGAIRQQQKA